MYILGKELGSMFKPQAFFNRNAIHWDYSAYHCPNRIQTMLLLSDIKPHSIILDVGCGTGVLEPYLLQYNPSAILAVDYAKNMIVEAQKKVTHEAVKYVCADIMDIIDLQVDTCLIFNAFGHFSEPEKALEHITTLIRPNGRLTISHTQGKRWSDGERSLVSALPPAHGLQKILAPYYYVDVVVDNNAMFLVSAIKR